MKNKKTAYIWILIIVEIISIPLSVAAVFDDSYTGQIALGYIGIAINVLGVIIALVWLYRAFFLKKDLVMWTHINFGLGVFIILVSIIGIYINTDKIDEAIYESFATLFIIILIWVTFVRHIHKSVATNRIQLN